MPGRARRWSFFVTAMGLCSVSGCFSHGGAPQTYTLFIDDAQIADVNHDGSSWCSGGAVPAVSVAATMAQVMTTTSEQVSLAPSWREPIADAEVFTYRKGLALDVRGRCDGATFFMGRALLHPDATMIGSGGVALGPIGNVTRLRLHFEPGRLVGGAGAGAGADPSFGYGDDEYGWYDPSPSADDPGYDWSDAPPDPGSDGVADDGSGDSGGDCCSDDGSGDPGGDYGGDPGGDSGGDSGDFRRLHAHGGVAAARAVRQKR